MTSKKFEIDGATFEICDISWQRIERKKWTVLALFVASLTAYDEVTSDDEEENAMHDIVHIFNEHCNSSVFEQTRFILLWSKKDRFIYEKCTNKIDFCLFW